MAEVHCDSCAEPVQVVHLFAGNLSRTRNAAVVNAGAVSPGHAIGLRSMN